MSLWKRAGFQTESKALEKSELVGSNIANAIVTLCLLFPGFRTLHMSLLAFLRFACNFSSSSKT